MDQPLIVCFLSIAGTLATICLVIFLAGGSSGSRVGLACRAFGRTLRDPLFGGKVAPLLAVSETKETGPPKPSGEPLRLLALLQRDGRLLDFLLEDIQAYPDAQIGAAVRDIHRQCQAALKEHLVLEPVLAKAEGESVEVLAGFDPSAIRLTGNVTGQPPFKGTLQHQGWRVKEIKLAPPPEGQDDLVLMPAEVELP